MKTILSTKRLSRNQQELILNAGLSFVHYDAISIAYIPFEIPQNLENAIFTSQNAVKAFFAQGENSTAHINCFCVGQKTKLLLEENGQKVIKNAENAQKLAKIIVKEHKNEAFQFFCGNKKREELPQLLTANNIKIDEIEVYKTTANAKSFNTAFDAVLFFSPSGVNSFFSQNKIGRALAVCIGNTTATAAEKHTQNIIIAHTTAIESVIAKAVLRLKK